MARADGLAQALVELQELAERLRRECPWDREQTTRTIVPHTVEEAYEVADAAIGGDNAKLLDEFGETALLGVVTDGGLEVAARAEPATDLHMSASIGRRLPANVGAHAKVLTGGADIGLDDEEYLPGVRAAAAPFIDARGRRIAVLIVVGFKERIDMRTLKRIGERAARESAALSAQLGRREAVA